VLNSKYGPLLPLSAPSGSAMGWGLVALEQDAGAGAGGRGLAAAQPRGELEGG
jgi:hypothetical protein